MEGIQEPADGQTDI